MKWIAYVVGLVCMANILFGIAYPNFTDKPLCFTEPNKIVVVVEFVLILISMLAITTEFVKELNTVIGA